MLKNYFKVAFRNLVRHKVFSIINILGLAVGMTACFLIYQYVRFETSYDAFHSKADRIYRVGVDMKTASRNVHSSANSAPVALNLKKDFPEVEEAVRFQEEELLVRKGDVNFRENKVLMADSSLFRIFDFPLVAGDRYTALTAPMSVVLSEKAAHKYFGQVNPVGQHLTLTEDGMDAIVTGVMKDIPENSQIRTDVFLSLSSYEKIEGPKQDTMWRWHSYATYILLRPNTNAAALEKKLPAFIQFHHGAEEQKLQMFETLSLEPLRDVYLHSNREGLAPTGNINNIYIFSIIALFILGIACINFINLTTARSTVRAKEVGVRKAAGATKRQLAAQFLAESVLICWVAFALTALLGSFATSWFNQLAGKEISAHFFSHSMDAVTLFLLSTLIGVIAGIYPSLVLSSFKAIHVLKGLRATSAQGLIMRKGLVVAQFTISIVLIVGTIVVFRQLHFMRSQDLGFNKDRQLIIDTKVNNGPVFRQSLASIPGVVSVSHSTSVPGEQPGARYMELENSHGDMQKTIVGMFYVDMNFFRQYGLQKLAGRTFQSDFATDSTDMMVNESAVALLGYRSPGQAIGKRFDYRGEKGRIIGVFKNFNYTSLKDQVLPLGLRIEREGGLKTSVKISTANLPATIAAIKEKWNQVIGDSPFQYSFLDEYFDQQYKGDEKFGGLFFNFAVLAIFISCLGVLGLASYSTFQRTKEIGVRKVLGASVGNIVRLLSTEFVRLVLLAFVIACPIGWYIMHRWLEGFAYRSVMGWSIFGLAGVIALLVVLLTISYQAIRAAVANPVKSLRTE